MEPQGRILDGNLETLGLQATLKMLALSGKTGVLSVTSGLERLAIFLDSGQIIDLEEPGTPAPDLIDMFRLLGRVSRDDANTVRQNVGSSPAAVMSTMVHWGLMSPVEQQQRTEFRVIQSISRAIRWERGRFEFLRDIAGLQARTGAARPLNVDHVLLESLRMADEWGRADAPTLSRGTVARWMPQPEFSGDITGLGLTREEIHVLCLSNGQFPLSAISYALLLPEPQVATIMQKLLNLGLIEVVDARLETELERSLMNLLTQSQHQLSQESRHGNGQRLLVLVRTMANCVNGLLAHHAQFARALRGRGEVPEPEVTRYLTATVGPALAALLQRYPRMDAIIQFNNGRISFQDLETLDRVIRGQELAECYWDAVQVFSQLMRHVFDRVLSDEVGNSRAGRQFEDLWSAFLREIDEEIERHVRRRAAERVQQDRAEQGFAPVLGSAANVSYAVNGVQDARRRFS